MSSDQPDQQADASAIEPQTVAAESPPGADSTTSATNPTSAAATPAQRIAIGSQRPGSRIQRPRLPPQMSPRPKPAPPQDLTGALPPAAGEAAAPEAAAPETAPQEETAVVSSSASEAPVQAAPPKQAPPKQVPKPRVDAPIPQSHSKAPVPSIRGELPPELQREVDEALGGISLDDVLAPGQQKSAAAELEPESKHTAQVVSIHNDDVFVELGGRNQGVLSLRQFPTPPAVGGAVEVVVHRFDPEEGLYQLTLPHAAIVSASWADIAEGVMVEARITGHNKGGLECEVTNIRGFIPASQVDVYRVEDFSQFVGQKFPCIVTEARPERGNLVLSRRAVIEREKAASKEKLLTELAEGQVRDGVVRSLQPFGAFVDLGGVDGLLHVSQLSWQRVKHPGDVLQLGQTVRVLVRKIDPESHKISLALRDMGENPWTTVSSKYPVTSVVTGTVTKIMDFGAFVELEPGVEGLVHISELAHQRVWRASDIVNVGDTVEAKVTSVDPAQQRIGLSMKALAARPGPIKKDPEIEEPDTPLPPLPKSKTPLKGGIGGGAGGSQFGLKW